MNLVIVESPSKSKTLEKYLGKNFKVVASVGHIRDLPKSKLGVDVDHNFKPLYVISPSKKKVVSKLKKEAKKASEIYLATDPDREGEAIAWHIAQVLFPDKSNGDEIFKRVTFNEITKDAVVKAFENPKSIDMSLVDAQQARRVLDRLVGYKLSPLLWKKIRYGLSAGRVQSVAVRFVVEREKEIQDFKSEKYWEIFADLVPSKEELDNVITANLIRVNDKPIHVKKKYNLFAGDYTVGKTTIDNSNLLGEISADLRKAIYKITSLKRKEFKRAPLPPFTTSTMQQEASWRLRFSPGMTMNAAQRLYEAGLITYMRTDSTNLSSKALSDIRSFICKEYGKEYLSKEERHYKTKVKVAQEAHEAIRPTKIKVKSQDAKVKSLGGAEMRLYNLIWKRAVACQMANAVYDRTQILIEASADKSRYTLEVKESVLKFPGWMVVYEVKEKERSLDLAELKVGDNLFLLDIKKEERNTPPPPRYSEASLIKELEKFGIGRPSTYAPIMSTIRSRGYVEKREGKLIPTDTGIVVTKLLVDHFPKIVDINFTARMEDNLDNIATGREKWIPVIREFYVPFERLLNEKQESLKKSDYVVIGETNRKCPKCGAPLVVKLGRYGKFLSCSKFPECKYMESVVERTGIKCPKCKDGDIIERRTKKGKIFYGCSNYPKCDFAVWNLKDI